MIAMTKALLYRMMHSRDFIGCVIGFSSYCVVSLTVIWIAKQPWFEVQSGGHFTTLLSFWGSAFVAGSIFAFFVSAIMVVLLASDLKTGFIKSYLVDGKSRISFIASYALTTILITLFFLILGMIGLGVGSVVIGEVLPLSSLAETAQWVFEVLCCTSACAMFCMALVVVFFNKTLGIIAAFAAALGIIENALFGVLSFLSLDAPVVQDFFNAYLASSFSVLGKGGIVGPEIYVLSAVTFGVFCFIAMGAMRYRSLA